MLCWLHVVLLIPRCRLPRQCRVALHISRARACFQDCIAGEHANFVRNDELRESWKLFDGLLHQVCAWYLHSSALLKSD